ncbi:hypothetical protein [uncultured Methanobrevibacter sp.]|uniref:hypothetical protein n=1 Tax=uncultured Methanobrevibacter sp. TaxID=253161 RepID=UPI00261CEE29
MYDTVIFEFDYSKDGAEFDIDARVYLENNSVLIDRKYKNSNDAIATERIRYNKVSDASINGSTVSITYPKGTAYLKGDVAQEFYDKFSELI